MRYAGIWLLVGLLAASGSAVFAQGDADFARQLAEFKQAQKRLDDARLAQQTLAQQVAQIVDELAQRAIQLEVGAEKAYRAAPNKDPDVTSLLLGAAEAHFARERFEHAARISKLLAESGAAGPELANTAGMSAFIVGDIETAAKYLKVAQEQGQVSRLGQFWITQLDRYRKEVQREQELRAAEAKADDLPRVELTTSKGKLVIELFENEAPNSVANFVSLVEKKYYDGLTFHRVLSNFMAQGGCPKGDGTGGPGYRIPCECGQPNHRVHFRGSLSMAHAGPNTGGSQFFLNFVPTAHLDGKHTVFGRVIDGWDVLAALQRRDPGDDQAPPADKIITAVVLRKRDHAYQPKTLKGD